ncbi:MULTISPECIES: DNA polymerase III subunit beta [Flectobacillus]|jgi:DNA polymerase-3 subunit beta|uniref:Beta sliding clamp n=1 Tax=Flectobacillus roseus TaxID=502259 RepID=A0ABT6Y635_9BACT|nr:MULTISPECIES: DNA polymerase III subunit beta [Flectobacillus]MDI9858553.1 DNA polymerase III subunit beta [Flectobacillus roseus]MDI9870961.1 DNA polymerase III subunit beta [Flectobacillus roseus]NBA75655.1 DNA polymerase III subunit beta [Emticicia sp. ODNR4P]PAC31749.1 DNA polymerase III subunit beta [Flectobacillus sp. BAB-3569]
MKFVVSSSVLLKQLSTVNGVITNNPIVPILENFLFQLEHSQLTVTASDLQTVMITTLEVESQDTGAIAVPARLLLDTLRGLPDQPITFKVDTETFGTEIITENGRYKLSGENPIDFPKVPQVSKSLSVEIGADTLGSAIANTIFAVSSDDLRPAMTGVYVQLNSQYTNFVATDGHRLIRYRRSDIQSEQESSMIIPRKALNLLKSSLPSDDTVVTADFSSSNAFFSFNNIKMICRLIDERFPDYENAIPQNNPNVLTINRQELLGSLKRISIYSNKTTHQIRLKLGHNDLVISAEDLDYSNEANEKLMCDYEGEPMEIGFNAKFLIEMLNNLSSNMISIEMSAPNRAGLIIPAETKENENILMLVMPVMLNSYA